MKHLTIIASITASPDKVDHVQTELQKLMAPTREEAGCISYNLHQNNDTPAHFLMFENWKTRSLWQAHMESDHFKQFVSATEGEIEALSIHEMTEIVERDLSTCR